MCGICGKINFNSEPIEESLIHKMTAVLSHRGPDDEGIFIKANIGLGHRRLSIIDLTSAAHQPMPNEDGAIHIVCNGEIYNFQELRRELEEKGHNFRSKSDTEVIIHLYEEVGVDCVKSLRGMFAFALWDENRKRLFLARDRVGKKPLNYAFTNRSFIFSSEIKSILQDPGLSRNLNFQALDLYLTYGYIPAPETIFSGIKKLPPAHTLVLEKGNIKIERYWSISYRNTLKLKEEDYCQRLLELFTEACKIRMSSDVALGAFLSGGIDSSAVVAMMSKISRQPIKTFSIGFKEQSFNELEYARKIAKLFNTQHHEYIVQPDVLEILPKLIWHSNEPFADSSIIPTYYLAKMSRQEVTVALNGDGGDESFAGYRRYAAAKVANIYSLLLPRLFRKGISSFMQNLPESTDKNDPIKYFKRFTKGSCLSKEERYASWMFIFDPELKEDLYSQGLKNRLQGSNSKGYIPNIYRQSDIHDFINSALFVDIMTVLPNDYLVKVDIASMANSLEGRSPFLDHKLMEFAASIPSNLKLKGITTKYILKRALRKILPPETLYRQKSGFGVPVSSWFKRELKSYAYDILLSPASISRGYFNKGVVKRILDEHVLGKIDHGHRIWSLINLELWHRMFMDSH